MTSRQEREGNSKYQAEVLNAMMAERHNKMCADCGTRGPRWASTNLGCFICIRCSGIHRNMGTHISKVRSVTLDKWSKEQVDFFKQFGNKACNRYFEDRMPDDFRRPNVSDDYQMERFIRAKYEHRKWAGKGSGPRAASADDDSSRTRSKSPKKKSSSSRSRSRPDRAPEQQQRQVVPAPQPAVQAPQQAQNLLFEPTFAPPPAAAAPAAQQVPAFVNVQQQPQQQQQQLQQQYQQPQMDKDALMSLYAPSPMAPMHGGVPSNAHGTGYNGTPNYNVHLPTQQQQQQQQPQYVMPQQSMGMYGQPQMQQQPQQQQQQFGHLGQMGQLYAQQQPQAYQQPQPGFQQQQYPAGGY